MSHNDYRPDQEDIDDLEFERALRALRRRRAITATVVAGVMIVLLAMPWSQSIDVSGRVAPARWARVRSEASGVVRELKRKSGEVVQEGDVIAVLDSDAQRDALESARLALTRERQELADLELRLQQNRILRDGSDVAMQGARNRASAAENVDDARVEDLEPAAAAVLAGVRGFTIKARGQLIIDGRKATALHAEAAIEQVAAAMATYVERAEAVAEQLSEGAGDEAGRELRARLDNVRFNFALAESSMREMALKHEVVVRGLLAPVELREIVDKLERESRDLAQSFAGLVTIARGTTGSASERREWVRSADEKRQLLAKETERLESERETVEAKIAEAVLAVRAAERNEGKTTIHAPIGGILSECQLAELDGVGPNASVGIIEDTDRLVLKVRVDDAAWPLVAEGQPVTANVLGGRSMNGTVVWKVPRAGQEVRDQEWNLMVRVDGDVTGIEPGAKVEGELVVGRRSLFRRLFEGRLPGGHGIAVAGTRLAFVDDPTEQRAAGGVGDLAAGGSGLSARETAGNN